MLKRISYFVFSILICLVVFFSALVGGIFTSSPVYAETNSYESQNIIDDLEGSAIAGKVFDLSDYPYNEDGKPQLINFVEYCYSIYSSNQGDYNLYVYIYNPQGYAFDTDSSRNKIQFTYGSIESYAKYNLEFLNYCNKSGYEGLFYKFKVVLSDSQRSAILDNVEQASRVYTISGIELSVGGTVTEYTVGCTYTYSGYALGYGSNTATESTLSCTVDGFDKYLTLDVHSTYYRPEGTNSEAYTRDTLHSVYFSVPNDIV